ncbi:MAG: DUF1211 domain-containing protein, partial [Chitinophagia bacterium]|nr:DUF1211 domain-containing protein [Chitinophagia bacterium]
MNKTRLEAFSDGVFAIIITIMVLEIKIPHGTLWADLCPLIPALFSYAMSFIYVGIYWGNHHHMVHAVKKVTPGIMWANMSLLFVLSLIPFATGWMGENHFAANTLILYATLLLLAGFTYTLLQLSIEHTHTFTSELQRAFSKMRTKGIISLVAYLLAIVLAMPA